ncbi:g6193 [Coccomyxa viridis]|uniref:Xaa-Pro dipeptidase n=1 Tax=Coccomyxa viridis TaxID=1274662 RepID=A0ABP1FX41_9CHLO
MDMSNGTMRSDSFSMGPATKSFSRSELHGPIRAKVREGCRKRLPEAQQGVLLLKGGGPFDLYSTDMEAIFRQESYFHYLFGVEEEDYYGALDLRDGRTMLFMPRLPESYAVWMGEIKGPDFYRQLYSVDAVHYADELLAVLKGLKPPALHLLHGQNTDSGRYTEEATFKGIEDFTLERETAFPVLTECRVIKTREELEIMQYANDIASAGHVKVMQSCKPGLMEYHLETTFLNSCYAEGGCRHAPYTPICASGPRCAVLHYGHAGAPNNKQIRDGDIMLQDMGCEYYSYDSDITCSFPANGRFTEDQKALYNAVLDAHSSVISAMKPGVSWPDMHLLAERCILKGLKAAGVVTGDVEEMLSACIGALFMPHGLGHLLGIDTHDVGGYGPGLPERSKGPGLKSLRTARGLEPNMVITVEPGCYFNPALLKPALEDKAQAAFLVRDRVLSLLGFGGVRLEDDVIVTESGARSMTKVPRSVEDVEAVMAGAPWPRQ